MTRRLEAWRVRKPSDPSRRSPSPAARAEPDRALAFLARLAAEFTTVLNLSELLEHVLKALHEDVGFDSCTVALVDESGPARLIVRGASGLRRGWLGSAIPSNRGPHGRVFETGAPVLEADPPSDSREVGGGAAMGSGMHAPLTARGRTVGVLSAHRGDADAFTGADLDLLTVVARYLAGAIEVANLHAQLKTLAATDPLTGLANRRAFQERLRLEIRRARRSGGAVSVAILDLDGFKRVNDALGHAAGDRALAAVARHLAERVRGADLVARFGGDEFTLVLADTTRVQAELAVRRLGVGAIDAPAAGRTLSAAWGIAAWPVDGDDPDALIAAADGRLYAMKHRR